MGVSSLQASVNRLNNLSQIMYTPNNNTFGITEVQKPASRNILQHQRWPPLQCPRCHSTNTKFCYYNNYSKTQPRYLCKSCRRHWTQGGTLRDVPVGGGRKNRRAAAKVAVTDVNQLMISTASSTASNAADVLLRQLHQAPPVAEHTISPGFGILSGLVTPRDIVNNNLGPYGNNNNSLNDTFSVSGYAQTGTGGDTDIHKYHIGMVPPVPVQLNTGNWSAWIEDISGLAAHLDVKPPPTNGGC